MLFGDIRPWGGWTLQHTFCCSNGVVDSEKENTKLHGSNEPRRSYRLLDSEKTTGSS